MLPAHFMGVQQPLEELPDVSVPLALLPQLEVAPPTAAGTQPPSRLEQATNWWLQTMGRLKPGVTPEQVKGNLESVFQHTARAGLDAYLEGLDDQARATAGNQNRTEIPRLLAESGARGIYDVNPDELRSVTKIDPTLPLTDVSTQIEQVEKRFAQERLFAQAYTLFGGLALLLASIGLFGLMSYSVSRRTNEIGIRMALGAQRQHVLKLVLGESMMLVVLGILVGIAIALSASHLISTLLYGLPPRDPLSMMAAVVVMVVVSALAGYLPARRASKVDPMVALHYE